MIMKKLFIFCLAILVAGSLYGQTIVGSAHDFSATGWTSNSEICVACHTPHNADPYGDGITEAPLWNHQLTQETFTVYSGYDMQAPVGQPTGISKMCLGCHDGTTAMDNFGGVANAVPPGTAMGAVPANFGTDLSNDHPISINMVTANAGDSEIYDPTVRTVAQLGGGTVAATMLSGGTQVECSSCHDVHNTSGVTNMLRFANTNSDLCLTCHNK
jgi:predicted CXXCH cytochrome family protein